mmetsp:Transcript_5781/g.17046  ORF Transcript_5781/g.17046 Transcript_5781/m.17046 type:complete len:335 (+) Transcript_5781:3564-4568(+)
MLRVRARVPPSQVAEQPPQLCHSIHVPFWQTATVHGSPPHGFVCAISSGSQGLPPMVACVAMLLNRVCCPPPSQVLEQVVHSLQSAQAQFWMGHWPRSSEPVPSSQPRTSSRGKSHALPPVCASTRMARWRVSWPLPHVVVQPPQSDHLDTRQGLNAMSHRWVLHAVVSSSVPLQGSPPFFAGVVTMRVLVVWPPLHVALQMLQWAHPPREHFTGCWRRRASSQGAVSSMGSSQAWPAPTTGDLMVRRRSFCAPSMQELHVVHSSREQSELVAVVHGAASQPFISPRAPLQGAPPFSALVTMVRRRVISPPPHFAVQPLHCIQTENSQSTATLH